MKLQQMLNDATASINHHEIKKKMAVTITAPQDDQLLINGKLVYQDSNEKWIASEELTTAENTAFRTHLQSKSRVNG